jgi:hypothetical protein
MAEVQNAPDRLSHRFDAPQAAPRAALPDASAIDERTYTHLLTVLSVSSGMVGVCLTAIGLIGIVKALNKFELIVDDLLAIGSVVFTVTAVMSFLGMRSKIAKVWLGFMRTVDLLFCLGLVLVVVATMLLTWIVV